MFLGLVFNVQGLRFTAQASPPAMISRIVMLRKIGGSYCMFWGLGHKGQRKRRVRTLCHVSTSNCVDLRFLLFVCVIVGDFGGAAYFGMIGLIADDQK